MKHKTDKQRKLVKAKKLLFEKINVIDKSLAILMNKKENTDSQYKQKRMHHYGFYRYLNR